MGKILYPELSYEIINSAFKVYNQMGFDHKEKYFQRSLAIDFDNKGIIFEQEKEVRVYFENKCVGKYFLDFFITDKGAKIVVELKVMAYPPARFSMKQVLEYLNAVEAKLAIVIIFTRNGVVYKRIVNPKINSL